MSVDPELAITTVCAKCGAELPSPARVCRRCGAGTPATPYQTANPAAANTSLLDRPWLILCLLFFVTAILGLPLLWMSRGFSRVWKIAISAAVTLYTALLLWGFWLIVSWSVSRIMDSLAC